MFMGGHHVLLGFVKVGVSCFGNSIGVHSCGLLYVKKREKRILKYEKQSIDYTFCKRTLHFLLR